MNHENTQTYIGFIDAIRHDPALVQKEKIRLNRLVSESSEAIKSAVHEGNATSLIWALSVEAMKRVTDTVRDLPNHRVTDFAGQSKHLRALAAAVPFASLSFEEHPNLDHLFRLCDELWTRITYREMIETVGASAEDQWTRQMAASMSLVDAFQREIIYQEQAQSRITKLYGPFSDEVVKARIGLTVEDIQMGFDVVRDLVIGRREQSADLMQPLLKKHDDYRQLADNGASDEELRDWILNDTDRPRLYGRMMESFRVFEQLLIFGPKDLEASLGIKSEKWFEAFSFRPGAVNQSYRTPFDADATKSRPFARLAQDEYLLTDFYYCPFAPLHRLRELFDSDSLRERLNKRRDLVLEQDAAQLLGEVCNPELHLSNYYMHLEVNDAFAERDSVIFRNNTALIVECKAKPLRDVSGHHGNIKKIQSDAKRSIQAAYDQACSVARLLASKTEDAVLYDSDKHNKTVSATIACGTIKESLPIVVLDTYYGLIATDTSPWLEIDPAVGYPWVVDRDTLESILWLMNSFDELVAFIKWRRPLNGKWINEDEAVFAGFYLRHGPVMSPDNSSIVQLDASYGDIFEAEYFKRKGISTGFRFPTAFEPATWLSSERNANDIEFRVDGELHDSINLQTGKSIRDVGNFYEMSEVIKDELDMKKPKPNALRIRRNDLCLCGSGKKFKNCCRLLAR